MIGSTGCGRLTSHVALQERPVHCAVDRGWGTGPSGPQWTAVGLGRARSEGGAWPRRRHGRAGEAHHGDDVGCREPCRGHGRAARTAARPMRGLVAAGMAEARGPHDGSGSAAVASPTRTFVQNQEGERARKAPAWSSPRYEHQGPVVVAEDAVAAEIDSGGDLRSTAGTALVAVRLGHGGGVARASKGARSSV